MKRVLIVFVVLGLVFAGLVAGSSAKEGAKRMASLSGDHEVPPADPDGSGKASVRLKKGEGEVCFSIKWMNIGAPTRAHIHEGAAGTNGDIVVPFFDTTLEALPSTISGVNGCVGGVDEALMQDIKKNPEEYYVNVHNGEFAGGAIRGQLRKP